MMRNLSILLVIFSKPKLDECVTYKRSLFNKCDYFRRIETKPSNATTNSLDLCALFADCYPSASYIEYNTSFKTCELYPTNACYQTPNTSTYDGKQIYEITLFGQCKSGFTLWGSNPHFGTFYIGVFGISQCCGMFGTGLFLYILIYKIIKKKRFQNLNKIGKSTNITKFGDFFTWTTLIYTKYGMTTTRHWECSVYYEIKKDSVLYSVGGVKYKVTAEQYKYLTESKNIEESYPTLIREGIEIIYDPNDIKTWVLKDELLKWVKKGNISGWVIFSIVMYIVSIIGTILFTIWYQYIKTLDNGNITTPLLVTLFNALIWPFIYYIMHKLCVSICPSCGKTGLAVIEINKSNLPNIISISNKNTDHYYDSDKINVSEVPLTMNDHI